MLGALSLATALACGASASALTLDAPMATAPEDRAPEAAPIVLAQVEPSATSRAAPAAQPVKAGPPPSAPATVDINPYNRDLDITAPLTFNGRVLGELPVRLTRDDRYIIGSADFIGLISPVLNPDGDARIKRVLAGRAGFSGPEAAAAGIELVYDPTTLSVMVQRIDSGLRNIQSVFGELGRDDEAGLPPQTASAYLNGSFNVVRQQSTGVVQQPSIFLNGAARYGRVVFEADVDGRESLGNSNYEINRRYARVVYDEPEQFRRWYLGDLEPDIRGRQGYVPMGGLGVSRERRRFDQYRPGVLSGDRRIILQRDSTVRVLNNGALVREVRLEAGQYDLSSLPLQTGANNVQVEIRDDSGAFQSVAYNAYLDPINLDPGDYEYAAYLGVTSALAFGSPDYRNGEAAFTGFWRKAFYEHPAVGVGLQASSKVQALTGQQQFLLPNGARVQFDAALSNSRVSGGGAGLAMTYDQFIDRGPRADGVTLQVEYLSQGLSSLGNPAADNEIEWVVSGQYSRLFDERLFGAIDVSYRKGRATLADSYRVSATMNYRISRTVSAQAGLEYTKVPAASTRDGAGVTLAIVWQPTFDKRFDARYSSSANSGSASFVKNGDGRVGAIGYSALSTYEDGPASVTGSVDYTGNRFDAGFSHTATGQNFDALGADQVTSVRAGGSIAYSGGKVAIGRRIFDSFAIVYPHENLKDRHVIIGDSLESGRYAASSGALGPAVGNYLTSYVNQTVRYDVVDAPAGYDIGEGVARLRPTYRSGYAIKVGKDAFVSALGTLVGDGGRPLVLTGGRIAEVGGKGATEPFFTNSAGRFAAQNLTPNHTYRVELFTSPAARFEFTVPADSQGLLDLKTIAVPVVVQ